MENEKRLIDATDENIRAILEKVPYYPDEIWKFTAMTKRFPTVDAVEVVHSYALLAEQPNHVVLTHKCRKCNALLLSTDNYCSMCGAKMDGGKDNA